MFLQEVVADVQQPLFDAKIFLGRTTLLLSQNFYHNDFVSLG